ncbi:MAG TPA: Na+/H+ antiporter NhaC family protein [Acidobacteriota bacterium]|nr:Na+/H+ antiporter NhaC family protein [Acidobacteriota bacterium]
MSAFFSSFGNSLNTLQDKVNMQIILFSLLAGGLLELIKKSNGFAGFIRWFERKGIFRSRKSSYFLTFSLNLSLFIDSWSNILITGSVMRMIYTKLKVSRERLAYFIHTTAINFVALVILNSWGAYYISLLRSQNITDPLDVIIHSIPFNYYCFGSLILVVLVMITGLTIGPMKKAKRLAIDEIKKNIGKNLKNNHELELYGENVQPNACNLVLPIIMLVSFILLGLYITGEGNLMMGSGSASLFYAACLTIFLSSLFFIVKKIFSLKVVLDILFKGMGNLLPIAALLMFAMTLGSVCKQLGTGIYLAELVKHSIPAFMLPGIIFGLSCVISFATGTSYGTFSIMIPIAMPMAMVMDINMGLMLGACIGGGVFGDNCSPISDTSILTSMVAELDVIDHIRTQIPYALIVASAAFALYILMGILQ